MGLVVGDDEGGLFKGLAKFVVEVKFHPWQYLQCRAHHPSNHLMITVTLLFRWGHQQDIKQRQRRDDDKGGDEKHQESQEGVNDPFECQRHLA